MVEIYMIGPSRFPSSSEGDGYSDRRERRRHRSRGSRPHSERRGRVARRRRPRRSLSISISPVSSRSRRRSTSRGASGPVRAGHQPGVREPSLDILSADTQPGADTHAHEGLRRATEDARRHNRRRRRRQRSESCSTCGSESSCEPARGQQPLESRRESPLKLTGGESTPDILSASEYSEASSVEEYLESLCRARDRRRSDHLRRRERRRRRRSRSESGSRDGAHYDDDEDRSSDSSTDNGVHVYGPRSATSDWGRGWEHVPWGFPFPRTGYQVRLP